MSTEEHVLSIESSYLSGATIPMCSCGWEGPESDGVSDAVEKWDDHCDAVFYEATMEGVEDLGEGEMEWE